MEKIEIKTKIRNIKLYRDQIKFIKFIKKINFKGEHHFESGCLVVKGDLDCSNNNLTSLPDNLVVEGNLDCSNNIVKLKKPKDGWIGGEFFN